MSDDDVSGDARRPASSLSSISMAVNPRDMDGFMPLLSTTDIKKKLNVGTALLNYLGDSTSSIECQDIGMFIDNVIPWLGNGNPKVSVFLELKLNLRSGSSRIFFWKPRPPHILFTDDFRVFPCFVVEKNME